MSKDTLLGLPETRLGFVPGLGGTQRLPRLIGVKNALDIILSAEPINVNRALEMNLIDKIVSPEDLELEMEKMACQLMLEAKLEAVDVEYEKQFASGLESRDQMALKTARRSMRMITKGNYPALLEAIDVIESGLNSGLKAGLIEEAKTFARLAVSEVSRNLVFLFFNSELIRQSALGGAEKEHLIPVKTIGIIGGGMMGMSLAKYLAQGGFRILFRSFDKSRTAQAYENIRSDLDKGAARRPEESNGAEKANDIHICAVTDDQDFSDADIIIEAIEENLSAKVSLLRDLKNIVKEDCLLATITSSLSVTDIACELKPQISFMGAHFFHPVEKMPLVEIAMPNTDYIAKNELETNYRRANAKLMHFVAQLGKTPLSVKDSTCFLVNRLLAVYLLEAARLAQANVPLSWIDKAAVDFGMPIGPLTLLDEIGTDIALLVADALTKQYPERIVLPSVLRKVEALGMKGKRFGNGIYMWDSNGKRLGINPGLIEQIGLKDSEINLDENESARISASLILPMIDEAAQCLEEKVVRRAREVDIGCVLGLGFPAFRGGILKYGDSIGLNQVVKQLDEIYAQSEPKRKTSNMLTSLVEKNSKFYS